MGRLRRSSSANSLASPCASLRETFAFDHVLYEDSRIAVTPSVLVVAGSGWTSREYEYLIEDVGAVRVPPLKAIRSWWRPRPTLHNLRVEVHSGRCIRPSVDVLHVHAENPGAALQAIEKAKGIVY